MAMLEGVEPSLPDRQSGFLPLKDSTVRSGGIEPPSLEWHSKAQPIDQPRNLVDRQRVELCPRSLQGNTAPRRAAR